MAYRDSRPQRARCSPQFRSTSLDRYQIFQYNVSTSFRGEGVQPVLETFEASADRVGLPLQSGSSDNTTPFLSVIIPVREGADIEKTLSLIRNSDWPGHQMEILCPVGTNPSQQRNLAALAAHGDILYFLDDDSAVPPQLFSTMMARFECPDSFGVCGPCIAPTTGESPWAQAVDVVLSSPLGTGPKRTRWMRGLRVREATDNDIIGCNFAVRKSAFVSIGGFDETLWPQEENELLERLRKASTSGHFWYVPDGYVYRPRPVTCIEYVQKLFGYGRTRMERFGRTPAFWATWQMAPAWFTLFSCLVVLCGLACGRQSGLVHAVAPLLGVYLTAVVAYGCMGARRNLRTLLCIMLAFPATHLAYGFGQWAAVAGLGKTKLGQAERLLRC